MFYIILFLNLFSFTYYGIDKYLAKKKLYRISENSLILFTILGPFGAYFGSKHFRHKTQKLKFKITIFLALAIHNAYYMFIVFKFINSSI
ncbi:MAG: DUF1294 domain-containing protein [Clostridia bacterium]|jgi:uncharacterized membrane protein YsdA (DUF1294 family)|nr:DUF1294 domain-containing protein [Clostridia bacterium]